MSAEIEYQGFKILYREHTDQWEVQDNGEFGTYSNAKLSACKEWIERKFKVKKQKDPRFPVKAIHVRFGAIGIATVTSKDEGNRYGEYYWITGREKQRSKERGSALYRFDQKIYDHIKDLEAERERLVEEIQAALDDLGSFTVPDKEAP